MDAVTIGRSQTLQTLGVLFLFNVLCIADRQVLGVLVEPLKADLHLSDTQIGLLAGLAFSLVYASFGIPMARLADKTSRRMVIGLSFVVWSAATALCGLAVGFWTLLAARFAVALGEAGFGPAAQAMIAEQVSPARRSGALGVFSLGSTVGIVVGLGLGGVIGQFYGWRAAFIFLGLVGLVFAGLTFLLPRKAPPSDVVALPFRETLQALGKTAAFWPLVFAASAHLLVAYGMTWNTAFLMRTHDLSIGTAGLWSGIIAGICGGAGALAGGWLGDRFARDRPHALPLIGAWSVLASVPFALVFYLYPDFHVALGAVAVTVVLGTLYQAPTYAAVQILSGGQSRATAAAIMIFTQNLIGMGLGPLVVGVASDYLEPRFGEDALRWALSGTFLINILSAILYFRAAKFMRAAPQSPAP